MRASLYFGYKRYLVSAEMLLAIFLFASGLRWHGMAAGIAAVCLEAALGTTTILRLIDINQVWDVAEYLLDARLSYLGLLVGLFLLAAFGFWIGSSAIYGIRFRWLSLVIVALILIQWQVSFAKANFFSPPFAERDELLFGSSTLFVPRALEENRRRHVHIGADADDAEYVPIARPSAASLTLGEQPASPRILFVIAESWGLPKDLASIDQQLLSLRSSGRVRNLRLFDIDAVGTTAAGELRELCGKIPTRLNFRQMTRDAVGQCLPAKLAAQGYSTVSLHAAFGAI